METHDKPPPFAFGAGHPSSPPMTPGSRSHARFPPQTSHTSPSYKRMGFSMLAQSPPLDFVEPIGQGPQPLFARPQSRDQSSRPSTASGIDYATSLQESEDDSESDQESTHEPVRPPRRVEKAEFILEELDSDPGYDSDIEVIRPDHYEDAGSDSSGEIPDGNGFIDKFKELHCEEGSSEEEERKRKYERKKKRWSAGIFKRSHSQSVEGDSSYSDNDPLDDVDSSARRLRRRVRGPGDRASLIFEDKGFANSHNIAEVEEPEDRRIPHSAGPPSIPSDDGFRLDELPFWDVVEDSDDMEVEDEDEDDDDDDDDSDEDEDIDSDSS
ncbi:hypothetical protein K505DRAFT_12857 [Melanomma pulvis-pyrius CBS 109.77]|uniref:Uncharacterized protein n=1 Tax=Melanomma pulvis-pyrius CBS 109.77 TaxID=1314802 RepID=A0A6A6XGA7_9PLEO|nr:hypothetical protein K505DRAFT_12857 [Melanomma pulvis-pyrius CBS 109.77]